MKFGFFEGPKQALPQKPPEVRAEIVSPLPEGVERLTEIDIKQTNPGDKIFLKTGGSHYLVEHAKEEPGKFIVYRKPAGSPDATWGVGSIAYADASMVAKEGASFYFLAVGNGELRPAHTSLVEEIELHRSSHI